MGDEIIWMRRGRGSGSSPYPASTLVFDPLLPDAAIGKYSGTRTYTDSNTPDNMRLFDGVGYYSLASDVCALSYVSSGNINAASGSIGFDYTPTGSTPASYYLFGSTVDASNGTYILYDGTNLIFRKRIAGSNNDASLAFPFVAAVTYGITATWGSAGMNISVNLGFGTYNSNTASLQLTTSIQIGADGSSGNQPIGYIKNLGVYSSETSFGLVNLANHVNVPQDLIYVNDIYPVRFNAVKHLAGKATYTNIRLPYTNARYSVDLEQAANYDFTINEAGILYNGTWYPATFKGSATSGTISKNFGKDITDVISGLTLPSDAEFYSFTKTVAADYLSAQITITGVTRATTGVVTYSGVDPVEGDIRRFSSVGGMTQLNYATNGSIAYKVKNLNTGAKTFELNTTADVAVNTTGYTAYTTGGVADRQYTHYGTTVGSTMTQDGTISGSDPAILINSIARGAKVLQSISPSKITAGVLTTSTSTILKDPANLGQNYAAGLVFQFFYGVAGADALGAIHPGRSASCFGSQTAGVLSSVTVTSGGAKYDSANVPGMYVGGTGSIATGWGAGTGMYGPIAVLGQPSASYPTVLLLGDSYNAGGGSFPDGSGPVDEYMLTTQQNATVQRIAVSGCSATQWITHNTEQLALLNWLKGLGVNYTHFYNAYGVNDFQYGNNLGTVQSSINSVNTAILGIFPNAKIIVKEIEPSVTSSDSYVTLAGQSAKVVSASTLAYGAGGYVEQYNTALRASNVTPIAYTHLVSLAAVVRDATTPSKFNVDLYKGISPGLIGGTGGSGTMTAVTQANPASVTCATHGLSSAYFIEITDGGTMTQLTGNRYKVVVVDANTFTLQTTAGAAVDSSAYTAFSGTGTWVRVGASTTDGIHRGGSANQKCIDTGYGFTLAV